LIFSKGGVRMKTTDLLAVARGDRPADLLLRGGRIVNLFSGQVETADLAVVGDRIAGIGGGYRAHAVIDLEGSYIVPGLIDAHVHIESSLCIPAQFAQAVVPRGVTTAVIDPHEIANVAGLAGVRFMAENSVGLPLGVVVMASSCVPATHMETSGAVLEAGDLAQLLADGTVHGLAEVMNFPGVVQGDPALLAKLAVFAGRPCDGHAPGLAGRALNAYVAAGIGSDHECTTVEEAREKLARGLYILIREATNARNLHTLLPLVDSFNSRRICFCTDDRVPGDLIDQGSVDYMVREAIRFGLDPMTALRMATLNPAEWLGLHDRGAIAPGRRADFFVCDHLEQLQPRLVFSGGEQVARDGEPVGRAASIAVPAAVTGTVQIDWAAVDLRVPAVGPFLRVIGVLPDQLVTEQRILPAPLYEGAVVADPGCDLLKLAVIERHRASGALGVGFIQGIGLRRGALAGTVAHDHHNLIVVGADDRSMLAAARAVAEMGGGLAAAEGEEILARLPLPVAGLMSDRPVEEVRRGYAAVVGAARALGSPLHDPLMAMSFMALEVIPALKLTDQGLVDVERFELVPLFVE
jgi:adenine deaminase